VSSLLGNRPEADEMLTSLSPITPPPDMHYPWNYFNHAESSPLSSSAAAGQLATNGGAFSWYGSRWPSTGDLKSPFGSATGNYFPSYDSTCFGSAPTHHQLNVTSNGPAQVTAK